MTVPYLGSHQFGRDLEGIREYVRQVVAESMTVLLLLSSSLLLEVVAAVLLLLLLSLSLLVVLVLFLLLYQKRFQHEIFHEKKISEYGSYSINQTKDQSNTRL